MKRLFTPNTPNAVTTGEDITRRLRELQVQTCRWCGLECERGDSCSSCERHSLENDEPIIGGCE